MSGNCDDELTVQSQFDPSMLTPHTTRPPGLLQVDGLICIYLALPLLLFCTWFKTPVAIGLLALGTLGFHRATTDLHWRQRELQAGMLLLLVALALAWTAAGGLGHFVYANTDWTTRDAVLRDLSVTPWPPRYPADSELPLILRAPVAYYLPASLVGWLWGFHAADQALYVWTAVGFALFAWAALTLFETKQQRVVTLVLLVGFGGLDVLGYRLDKGSWPRVGEHLEWWAHFAQYSSNATLLFWVPNHALPAWLSTIVILRHWRQPELARIAPLLGAAALLWSPLAAIGIAPFLVTGIDWRRDTRTLFSIQSCLPFIALALLVARYLTMDSAGIPGQWLVANLDQLPDFLERYAIFCTLEFGLLTFVLAMLGVRGLPFITAVTFLAVLPLFRFGIANDLAMRASIPALTVIALATVLPLTGLPWTAWRIALVGLLLVGALGAAQEPLRAVLKPRWSPAGLSLGEASAPGRLIYDGMLPAHYAGRLDLPGMMLLLREPTLVPPSKSAP